MWQSVDRLRGKRSALRTEAIGTIIWRHDTLILGMTTLASRNSPLILQNDRLKNLLPDVFAYCM